jgi:putative methionine-R-sulfoxide reductase with GAF domain
LIMSPPTDADKPWKTDLARRAAQRREQILSELEEGIRKAPSFEDALRHAVYTLKKRFARFSSVTSYVADGESLAVHIALERPQGPERAKSDTGPLAEATHADRATSIGDVSAHAEWTELGLVSGSVAVTPIRTEAGLWALIEVWSDFRDAFTPPDLRLLERVSAALAKKTPAA